MIIVSKREDLKKLESYPKQVLDYVNNIINILDDNYGKDRDIYKDLGGHICIIESIEDVMNLRVSKIDGLVEEFSNVLCECKGNTYSSTLYLLSTDYSVVIITRNEITDELLK